MVSRTRCIWCNFFNPVKTINALSQTVFCRWYAKKSGDDCRQAIVDMPPEVDSDCPEPCVRRTKKKESILHKIKMRLVDGGTNFGS